VFGELCSKSALLMINAFS